MKELTNIDVAKGIYEEKVEEAEEEDDGFPLGFARINSWETVVDNDGDVWTSVNDENDGWFSYAGGRF